METEIVVYRAEIELEREGVDLDWSTYREMERVIDLIIGKCEKNEWDICRSAVTQLFIDLDGSPS